MKSIILLIITILISQFGYTQIDPVLLRRIPKDTTIKALNMDAVYNRPFIGIGKIPVALGGYLETNWQKAVTDGATEGHQFQLRRMSLFVSSAVGKRMKFMSEIEFEDGGREISIEYTALDVEFSPLLNLRAGIILNPIGSFNQNHDGPKWEFIDRPISATQMLPATFSNAGFGIYGKKYTNNWMFGYEIYLTGGFDNSIIENTENKTFLPASKKNPERFGEIASGQPLLTTKIAVRNNKIGELGLSYMGGVYNKYLEDGIRIDDPRRCDIVALDFNTTLPKTNTFITGEWACINVAVPGTYSQQFGKQQQGGFIDIVQPILKKTMFGWDKAVLNFALRGEYVDWNKGKFKETGDNIGDYLWSIMPAISFRPTTQTVFRLNYRIQKQTDILNNPPATTGVYSFGISTYF